MNNLFFIILIGVLVLTIVLLILLAYVFPRDDVEEKEECEE